MNKPLITRIADRFINEAGGFLRQKLAFLERRNRLNYESFEITDPQAVQAIYRWYGAREEAKSAVQQFLADYVNRGFDTINMGYDIGDCVVNDEGRIEKIAYTGAAGFYVPDGWIGMKEQLSTFMIPNDGHIQKALNALPDIPTRRDLHDIVGWPTFPGDTTEHDFANHLVEAYIVGDQTFIKVPRADNFRSHPEIQEAIAQWFKAEKPQFLSGQVVEARSPDNEP